MGFILFSYLFWFIKGLEKKGKRNEDFGGGGLLGFSSTPNAKPLPSTHAPREREGERELETVGGSEGGDHRCSVGGRPQLLHHPESRPFYCIPSSRERGHARFGPNLAGACTTIACVAASG